MKTIIKYLIASVSAKFKIAPSVFIVGFQKCGTTSLYNYLLQLCVYLPGRIKENNYLPRCDVFNRNIYLWHFPWKWSGIGKRTLDASHLNSYYPSGLCRIKRYFPDAKIIFIMRDPVKRAYSHYQHNVRLKDDYTLSFSELLDAESEIIKNIDNLDDITEVFEKTISIDACGIPMTRGLYVNYLRIAQDLGLDYHAVCLEMLISDFEKYWAEIVEFLEIDTKTMPDNRIIHGQAPPYSKMDLCDIERLAGFYKNYNRQLFSLVGEEYPWCK